MHFFVEEIFVKDIVKQVLSVYNYSPKFSDDWTYKKTECTNKSNTKSPKDKFIIKSDVDASRCILQIGFEIKSENKAYRSEATLDIARRKECFKHADFLGSNCLKVVKSLIFAYDNKYINSFIVESIIERTIEESIIAIMIGNKQSSALTDPMMIEASKLVQNLSYWSNRTYEGRKIPFSFLIDTTCDNKSKESFDIINSFLTDDASALLTDGITSYISIAQKLEYRIANFCDPEIVTSKTLPLVPYRFSSFANICTGKAFGVVLTVQGDVLFIKRSRLVFAKRNGLWHYYDYDAFNTTLFHDIEGLGDSTDRRQKIKKIYICCLDTAFARTGGCLAICIPNKINELKKNIDKEDIHKPFVRVKRVDERKKRLVLEEIVIDKKTFYEMDRKALQEIIGIDGATIISTDGRFITTGAIINNNSKCKCIDYHGGARTKIAKKLSDYGVAIKISADGYIECYKDNVHIF